MTRPSLPARAEALAEQHVDRLLKERERWWFVPADERYRLVKMTAYVAATLVQRERRRKKP